jgi:hypothetical protein
MSLYLMCVYGATAHSQWFQEAWAKSGKKLDMGKACVRFKKLDDLALDVIGEAIKRVPAKKYIEHCEAAIRSTKGRTSKDSTKARKSPKLAKSKAPKSRSPAGKSSKRT